VEAARADVRELIAVGGASARALADGAVEGGIPAPRVHYIENSKDAADLAATVVKPGDIVLVKGSRGIRTDVVVDRLKAECA
jgi:UDP-N-acetylmuramoyl-tripeptide--D-alanyl-D-alanine ligase